MHNPSAVRPTDDRLILLHYFTSVGVFWLTALLLALQPEALTGHYFEPKLLAITHLAVFGWLIMLILGALYQMLPVMTGKSLYSEKLGYWTFGLLVPGTAGLVYGFQSFAMNGWLHVAGTMLVIAVGLFTFNAFKTFRKDATDIRAINFIGSSLIWLLVTVLLGLLLALNLTMNFLPEEHLTYLAVHAHIGGIGWFLLLIMGVAIKLFPMFALTHGISYHPLDKSFWLMNGGLLAFVLHALVFQAWWSNMTAWALLVAGIGFFARFIIKTYQKRMRRNLDTGMRQSFAAFAFLLIPVIAGTLVVWVNGDQGMTLRLKTFYGTALFLAFIGPLVLGMTFKTLAFIVWMHDLQPYAVHHKVPMPHDLYPDHLLKWQFRGYVLAILGLLAGILLAYEVFIQASAGLLVLAVALYCFNVANVKLKAVKIRREINSNSL